MIRILQTMHSFFDSPLIYFFTIINFDRSFGLSDDDLKTL